MKKNYIVFLTAAVILGAVPFAGCNTVQQPTEDIKIVDEGSDTKCEITGYTDLSEKFGSYFPEKGDKIAVISPSALPTKEQKDATVEGLKSWGYTPVEGKYVCVEERTLENCIEDLEWALNDPEIKAIYCVRGGHASSEVMDELPIELIASADKPIIGYSDISVYHSAWSVAGLPSVHASMSAAFMGLPEECAEAESHLIQGEVPSYKCAASGYDKEGKAEGVLIGGNLSTVLTVLNTEYDVTNIDKPYILFLEDVDINGNTHNYVINSVALNTLRIIDGDTSTRLVIRDKEDNTICDLPIARYLTDMAIAKIYSGLTSASTVQEFLDYTNEYDVIVNLVKANTQEAGAKFRVGSIQIGDWIKNIQLDGELIDHVNTPKGN